MLMQWVWSEQQVLFDFSENVSHNFLLFLSVLVIIVIVITAKPRSHMVLVMDRVSAL